MRPSAAAEAEKIDLDFRVPIPAQEAIQLADVCRHPEPDRAIEESQRLEARGPDTLDVIRHLLRTRQVERGVEPPNIRFLALKGIARAIRENDDRPDGSRPSMIDLRGALGDRSG